MRNIIAFLVIFDFFFLFAFFCKLVIRDIPTWLLAYSVIILTVIVYLGYVALMRGRKV